MRTTEYITSSPERWDSIAYKAYGSVEKMDVIIRANPAISIADMIPEGILLQIPILPETEIKTANELLPLWKRT